MKNINLTYLLSSYNQQKCNKIRVYLIKEKLLFKFKFNKIRLMIKKVRLSIMTFLLNFLPKRKFHNYLREFYEELIFKLSN